MTDLTSSNPVEDTDVILYVTSNDKEFELRTLKDTIPLMQSAFDTDRKVAEFAQTVFRYVSFMDPFCMKNSMNPMSFIEPMDLQSIELYRIHIELSKLYRWLIDELLKERNLISNISITLKGIYLKLYKAGWGCNEVSEESKYA